MLTFSLDTKELTLEMAWSMLAVWVRSANANGTIRLTERVKSSLAEVPATLA